MLENICFPVWKKKTEQKLVLAMKKGLYTIFDIITSKVCEVALSHGPARVNDDGQRSDKN